MQNSLSPSFYLCREKKKKERKRKGESLKDYAREWNIKRPFCPTRENSREPLRYTNRVCPYPPASLWVLGLTSTKTSSINRSPPSKFLGIQPSPRLRRLLFPLCISEASHAPAPLVPSWASNLLGPLYLLQSGCGWGKSQINFGGRVGGSSRIKFWRVWSSSEFCFSLKRKRKKK